MRRTLPLLALQWILIASLLVSSALVPAQLAHAALHVDSAADMASMPCHDPAPAQLDPCEGCTPATCDLAACLGTACLPPMPRIGSMLAVRAEIVAWYSPGLPI